MVRTVARSECAPDEPTRVATSTAVCMSEVHSHACGIHIPVVAHRLRGTVASGAFMGAALGGAGASQQSDDAGRAAMAESVS